MKAAALLFFALLIYVHQACDLHEPLGQPLCAFRDGETWRLGYAVFGAMALIGAIYTISLRRFGRPAETANTIGGGLLLLIVVLTPAPWALHGASTIVLLGSLYVHYGILLSEASCAWTVTHLSAPLALATVTGFQSYGLWQKGLICYFVVVAVVHHHFVKQRARGLRPTEAEILKPAESLASSSLVQQ
jgi:hypothetical protein